MVIGILDYLEQSVAWLPQKYAVRDSEGGISFVQLRQHAMSVGCQLLRRGFRREPVVVYVRHRPEAVAAMLGVVYAGCWFVPLEETLPSDQVETILKAVQPRVILGDEETALRIRGSSYADRFLQINSAETGDIPSSVFTGVCTCRVDTDPVCILFPSGQIPGILVSHRGAAEAATSMGHLFGCNSNTVFGSHADFSGYTWLPELLCTLKYGASVYLLPSHGFQYPGKLLLDLTRHQINTLVWNTKNLAMVSATTALSRTAPKSVQTVAFFGETLTERQLESWMDALPTAKFWSLYGPAESLGITCYAAVSRKTLPGKENFHYFPNIGIVLLNSDGSETLPGMIGEICVRGSRLSPGYFRNPELTAQRYVQNPQNSDIPERLFRTGDLGRLTPCGTLERTGQIRQSPNSGMPATERTAS